jgi:hypothetical protein
MPGILYDGQYYDKHKRIPKEQSEMDKNPEKLAT